MKISSPLESIYSEWSLCEKNTEITDQLHSLGVSIDLSELDEMPQLKEAIFQLNCEKTAAVALGCLFKHEYAEEGTLLSYLDFSFRPSIDTSKIDTSTLDQQFIQYIQQTYSKELADLLSHHLIWEYSKVSLKNKQELQVYSVILASQDPDILQQVYVPLVEWLHKDFLYLTQ